MNPTPEQLIIQTAITETLTGLQGLVQTKINALADTQNVSERTSAHAAGRCDQARQELMRANARLDGAAVVMSALWEAGAITSEQRNEIRNATGI